MEVRWMVVLSLGALLVIGPGGHVAWAQTQPPLDYFSVSPCRVLDTRSPAQGPALASGASRVVTVTSGPCGIPATARAITANITSVAPTGVGNLRLYPGDGNVPPTSALNFGAGQIRANNGVFPLAGNRNGTLAILATVAGSGTVHVVLDVTGYFAPLDLEHLDPGLLVVVDNSGSMNTTTTANPCGFPTTRFGHVKCAVQHVINGLGDVMFGLTRFATTCTGAGSCTTSAQAACSTTASGDLLTGITESNHSGAVGWVDGVGADCRSTCAAPELLIPVPAPATPLAAALLHAKAYFEGLTSSTSPIVLDRSASPPRDRCRRYAVVLITDGEETCAGGDPVAAATALHQTTVGGEVYDLPTYVVGIGFLPPDTALENMAIAGGTDAPGATHAYYANSYAELTPQLLQIAREVQARSGCLCVFRGAETCNGLDDDCNGLVDDGVTPPPSFVCRTDGACGLVPKVCDARLDRWICDYGPAVETDGQGNIVAETRCDGLDNDCDGVVDRSSAGVDVCAACSPGNEVCDGRDNDCDGLVDEPKSAPGSNPFYIDEPLAQVGLNLFVSAYEASRPDATRTSAGFLGSRACARAGVLPWSGATYGEAAAACQAAGLRLCTEAEWQTACRGGAANCTWSTPTSCTTYGPTRCNGTDFDPVPGAPDDDRVVPTADMFDCYAQHAGGLAGRIFDLSGNLKEWTSARAPDVSALRGGSYTEPGGGLTCTFNAVTAGGAWTSENVGFRCCSSTAP